MTGVSVVHDLCYPGCWGFLWNVEKHSSVCVWIFWYLLFNKRKWKKERIKDRIEHKEIKYLYYTFFIPGTSLFAVLIIFLNAKHSPDSVGPDQKCFFGLVWSCGLQERWICMQERDWFVSGRLSHKEWAQRSAVHFGSGNLFHYPNS